MGGKKRPSHCSGVPWSDKGEFEAWLIHLSAVQPDASLLILEEPQNPYL